eukprot:TRINITY_DN2949_c0_g1_i2.p1 TRINITY_DN2949_c0_g1~~TRINITY_DN2949_c0_g1_i2.p1  ORF type:complete len:295 (-),score=83.77 TRINITY_DN2949_c0_g1_i2:57-941(-)
MTETLNMNMHAEKFRDLGTQQFKCGDMDTSLMNYTRAIQLDESHMEYPLCRAAVYMANQAYDQCIEDCKQVIELALLNPPTSTTDELLAKAYARMGTAYFAQGKYALALRCVKTAYQTLPHAEFKQMQHQLESINDKMAQLLQEMEKGKGKEPMRPPPSSSTSTLSSSNHASAEAANFCQQAKEAFKADDFEGAAALYTQAVNADPTNTRAVTFINRSACYHKAKQYELALLDADKALELDPDVPQGYFRKGCALEGLKRKEEAFDQYEMGLQIAPDHTQLNKRYQILKKQLAK